MSIYSLDYKTKLECMQSPTPINVLLEMQDTMLLYIVKCLNDPNDTMNIRSKIYPYQLQLYTCMMAWIINLYRSTSTRNTSNILISSYHTCSTNFSTDQGHIL